MIRRRPDSGYMLMVIMIFGVVLTALGALLLWPTRSALHQSQTTYARLAARQAARSGLEIALDDPAGSAKGAGQLGAATYRYEVETLEDGRLRVRVVGLAPAGTHTEEAVLETDVRLAEGGTRTFDTWRLFTRRGGGGPPPPGDGSDRLRPHARAPDEVRHPGADSLLPDDPSAAPC